MTKKFLCILFTMILIGSLLIIPISAAQEVVADDYIIPAGDYRFNDTLTDFSSLDGDKIYFDFVSNGSSFNYILFITSTSQGGVVLRFFLGGVYIYLNNSGYIQDGQSYRDITVTSDANVSEAFYNWFFDNVTSYQPDPPSALEHILSIFIAVGQWLSSGFASVVPMFYVGGELTAIGVIVILSMALSVVFFLINVIVGFLCFSR